MPEVRLVDLDVIKRFSLAVRRDTVPAEELLEALDASRAVVVAALGTPAPARRRPPAGGATAAKAPAAKTAKTAKTTKKTTPATRRRATGS